MNSQAPTFGSAIALINDARLTAGKSPVGFINPVLYAHPDVLNDIATGDNPGCDLPGFNATAGWDPVTGLGTPNYPKLLELYLYLP
jgi:tripeptidyl-peptidase-1